MSYTASQIEALATDADLPQKLAAAIRDGHRGKLRGARMSPQLSYGRHAGPAPVTVRAAAVMMLLFRRGGRWHLPLTERPTSLARHGGQISLPGGAIDRNESSGVAACRELKEELGIETPVELLGRLADCYVFASDFLVTPWIATVNFEPHWRPQVREVKDVVELPLDVLLDEDAVGRLTIESGPLVFHAPCNRVGATRIWGATSVILSELCEVLRSLMEKS